MRCSPFFDIYIVYKYQEVIYIGCKKVQTGIYTYKNGLQIQGVRHRWNTLHLIPTSRRRRRILQTFWKWAPALIHTSWLASTTHGSWPIGTHPLILVYRSRQINALVVPVGWRYDQQELLCFFIKFQVRDFLPRLSFFTKDRRYLHYYTCFSRLCLRIEIWVLGREV